MYNKKIIGVIRTFFEKIIYALYHSYIGCILYNLTDRLTCYKLEKRHFFKRLGYYPDLKNPQSFNEKMVWKKIHDRNPLLPIISDKYRVRDYLKEVLGEKEAQKILIPLLFVTDKPESIPFDDLAGEYVIKPNHTSGKIILAENVDGQKRYTIVDFEKTRVLYDNKKSRNEIIQVSKNWIAARFGYHNNEWAYQKIKRKIIVEKLLRDSSGKVPADFKISFFNGKCNTLSVWYDRFDDLKIAWYTPDWDYLNTSRGHLKKAERKKKPENLKSLIDLAELLVKPFDYIRIDLYLVDDKIYFGELTSYSASGRIPFKSLSEDMEMGSKWNLIPGYWKKY